MDKIVEITSFVAIFVGLYFEVFLLISLLEKKPALALNAAHNSSPKLPSVSVIVPCFNEETTVSKTITSLLALDYPVDCLNIIVVNDGSTDGTRATLTAFENNPRIQIFHKENGGKYTALNFGIEKATSEFVGCLDSDSFVDKAALRIIMAKFRDPKVMAVTPSMIIADPKGIVRKMQRAEYSYGNFLRKIYSRIEAVHITPGPFSFFRKEVFRKIGLYKHAHNTEDMEMAMRMQKHRMQIVSADGAFVYTVGPGTVKKLYKQRVRWVSGFISNLIDYRDMLFKKKYGDLGLIILPFSIIGILLSFAFVLMSLYQMTATIMNAVVKFSAVGFVAPSLRFDVFFTNTSTLSILSLTMIAMIIALVFYEDHKAGKSRKFSFDALYFVFLYSFISPFWLITSIYNNLASKTAPWR
ncbi:MAG: glycosyltransferase [Patescibacteria group bacterium]